MNPHGPTLLAQATMPPADTVAPPPVGAGTTAPAASAPPAATAEPVSPAAPPAAAPTPPAADATAPAAPPAGAEAPAAPSLPANGDATGPVTPPAGADAAAGSALPASGDAATGALPALPPPGTTDAATAQAAQAVPVDQAAQVVADHSMLGLILQAGPVVQGVMGALVLASVVCWTIIIEKGFLLGRLNREIKRLGATGDGDVVNGEGLAARIQRAAAREWADGRDSHESRGEYRERIERAMRETLTTDLRRAQHGTAFLATTGAVGPFVGLFGTVWGIMGSFQGIAQMHDTSLAVVAPGIAEALLATAIGLFAAIPAVIGYNRIARRVAGLRADGLAAISAIGARLSARPPRGGHVAARAAE